MGAIMLKFSVASDIIDQSLIVGKLQRYGFSPTVTMWLRHYLSGSKQRVFLMAAIQTGRSWTVGSHEAAALSLCYTLVSLVICFFGLKHSYVGR